MTDATACLFLLAMDEKPSRERRHAARRPRAENKDTRLETFEDGNKMEELPSCPEFSR